MADEHGFSAKMLLYCQHHPRFLMGLFLLVVGGFLYFRYLHKKSIKTTTPTTSSTSTTSTLAPIQFVMI